MVNCGGSKSISVCRYDALLRKIKPGFKKPYQTNQRPLAEYFLDMGTCFITQLTEIKFEIWMVAFLNIWDDFRFQI